MQPRGEVPRGMQVPGHARAHPHVFGSLDSELDTLTLDDVPSGPPSSTHPGSTGALEPPGGAGGAPGALMRSPASLMSSPGTPLSALLASGMPGDEDVDEEAEPYDVDEEDMHAVGIPAARGWRLDPRYVRAARSEQRS